MQLLFREKKADEVEQEVTQRDQFNTDEVGLVATLIRETHQNSLDAKSFSTYGAVKTRIRILEPREETRDYFRSMFSGLEEHLQKSEIDIAEIDFGKPRLLLIEDFGTTGLCGRFDDSDDEGAFNDFWRRIGRSHKSGTESGRWGLGKLVFSSVSKIRTFFGLTIRHNDPDISRQQLLMGQTVLSTHRIGKKKYAPHGFFAIPGPEGLQLPVLDPSEINLFRQACGITRANEPGLSIVIPFFLDELTPETMIPEVLRNYFFPILTSQLEVEIQGESINAATFDTLYSKYATSQTFAGGHLIEFIRKIHAAKTTVPDVELKGNWPLNIEASMDAETLTSLRMKYMVDGELIHVKAPIALKRKDGSLVQSHFALFLQKAPEGVRSETLYVRGAITVPDESRYFKARQIFGALVAADAYINSFLGDAENPAHTKWNGTAEKLAKNWQAGRARLSEIRNSLDRLHHVLAQSFEARDPDALKDFFSVKDVEAAPGQKRRSPTRPIPVITRTPKNFKIEPNQGGFTIKSGPGLTPEKLPVQIKVRAAYDVFRGNPFKHFDPYDFNFNEPEIMIECRGATLTPASANELRIEVTEVNFRIKVSGFDQNRDLIVDAR